MLALKDYKLPKGNFGPVAAVAVAGQPERARAQVQVEAPPPLWSRAPGGPVILAPRPRWPAPAFLRSSWEGDLDAYCGVKGRMESVWNMPRLYNV